MREALLYLLPCVYAFLACIGFSMLFNIHGAGMLICAGGGALGWLCYLLTGPLVGNDIIQSFFAALVISAWSEVMARLRKCPVTSYLLVALFPGDLTLQEAQQLLHNRPRTGWSSVAAFLAQPTLQKTDTTLARPWLTVHSARFIAAFTVVTGNLRFQLHSVLQQSGRTFTVVQRRYGLSMVVDEQD